MTQTAHLYFLISATARFVKRHCLTCVSCMQVTKMAPGLSHKALHPSDLERQNVKLVLKIFDEKAITAVDTFAKNTDTDISGTSTFLSIIILRLWKVLDVKSTGKGRRRRDTDMEPIRGVDDSNVVLLRQVYDWLVQWEALQQKVRQGRLSNETMFALKHTVFTLVQLINYLFEELHVSYVLTGKFQTDYLEFRFSQYRQLSGNQRVREKIKINQHVACYVGIA